MARKDTINLEAVVTTDQAKNNIQDLNNQLRQTTQLIDELGGSGSTGGDLDQVYNRIREDLRKIGEVRSQTSADARSSGAYSSSGERVSGDSIRQLDKEFDRVIQSFSDRISNFIDISEEQRSRATRRPITWGGPSFQEEPRPDSLALRTREIQRTRQQVSSRTTSAISSLQNAADTGDITYKQAERLRGYLENVYYDNTGATPEYFENVRQIENDGSQAWADEMGPNTPLRLAQENIQESPEILQNLQEQLSGVRALQGADGQSEEAIAELNMTERSILKEIKEQEKFEQENQKLLTEIIDSVNRVDSSVEQFEADTSEEGVSVAPQEGTVAHAMSERSNAIALSMVTAAAYSLGNSLQQGQSVVEAERPDSQQIGFSSGNYDFREIRQDARDRGSELGFRGRDMLEMTNQVMQSMGYNEETTGVSQQLARGTRFSGVSEDQMRSLYETNLRSGAVETEDQAADMQEAITGGIIDSGMVGRQEEQVTAMNTLLSDLTSGREVSNEELQRQLSMFTMFSQTGSEALQGQNLAQNIGSINSNIQSSSMFSDIGFMMGVGREEEFAGPGGAFAAAEQRELGLGSDYMIEGITEMVQSLGMPSALDQMVGMDLFEGVSTDAIREIAELAYEGDLSSAHAQRIAEQTAETGEATYEEAEEEYMDSPDQTRQQRDADREARQAQIDESWIGDIGATISGALEGFGSGGVGQSIITGLTTSLSSALLTSLSGPIFGKISTMIKDFAGGGLGGLGDILTGGSLTSMGKGLGGGSGGGFLSTLAGGAKGLLSSASGWLQSPGNLGKLGKGGLIANTAYQTVTGVGEIAQADNKAAETASQVGSGIGNVGGMWAGGKAGAALGSFAGVPGMAIGGILGGLGGGLLGEEVLGGIGDWVGNTFFGGTDEQNAQEQASQGESDNGIVQTVEAGEMTPEERAALYGQTGVGDQQQTASTNEELSLQTQRENTESLRQDNVEQESDNLSVWDNLLNRISNLLETARRQNGIIGMMNGMSSGGMGVGGELGYTDEGDYWTSSDLTQHDLGKTTSTLTGDQLDDWISDKAPSDSSMLGMGDAFMEAGQQSGLDPRYLVSHAAWETAWGTSNINSDKNNFYGIGAFDDSSYSSAYDWSNPSEGIIGGANWIADNYYAEGDTTLSQMGERYATDPNWAQGIADTMRGAEGYTSRSEGDVNIETNVSLNSTGSNEADAQAIARNVNANIAPQFSREYRPI